MKTVEKIELLKKQLDELSKDSEKLTKLYCDYSCIRLMICDLEIMIDPPQFRKYDLSTPGNVRYNGYFMGVDNNDEDLQIIGQVFRVIRLYEKLPYEEFLKSDFPEDKEPKKRTKKKN